MSNPTNSASESIDLRGVPCPLSFVRAKLRLEKVAPGQIVEVWLDGGEAIEQVPNSLAVEGHKIHSLEQRDRYFALTVERA
jgi:TusA-related sulfurtransferase